MNALENVQDGNRKVQFQIQFWSLVGPFLILLSTFILFFKISNHWYYSLSALIGIPCCVIWRMKGLACALASLFVLSTYGFQGTVTDESYWHVGFSIALAFSFVILTLCLEEVHELLNTFLTESQSRLNNIHLLDERWKTSEKTWIDEQSTLSARITVLTVELAKAQEEKTSFYKLVHLAKDELLQLRSHHDVLIQDLIYKKQQIVLLNEKLEECESTIQCLVDTDQEKELQKTYQQLEHSLSSILYLEATVDTLKKKEEALKEHHAQLLVDLQKIQEKEIENSIENQLLKDDIDLLRKNTFKLESSNAEAEAVNTSIAQRNIELELEKNSLNTIKQTLENNITYLKNELNKTLCQLQTTEIAFHNNANDYAYQIRNLQSLYEEGQQELTLSHQRLQNFETNQNSLKNEIESLQKTQEHEIQPKIDPSIVSGLDRECRKFQGLYVQLKTQFEDKSCTLDETRHKLFHTEEKLTLLERQFKEDSCFAFSEEPRLWMRYCSSLNSIIKSNEEEIDQLVTLISKLSTDS